MRADYKRWKAADSHSRLEFGRDYKIARIDMGFPHQNEFAEHFGISQAAVSSIENGNVVRMGQESFAAAVSAIYRCTEIPAWLLEDMAQVTLYEGHPSLSKGPKNPGFETLESVADKMRAEREGEELPQLFPAWDEPRPSYVSIFVSREDTMEILKDYYSAKLSNFKTDNLTVANCGKDFMISTNFKEQN